MSKIVSPYGLAALAAYLLTQPLSNAYAADPQAFKDDLVKAGFVYNFIKFVEWPGEKDLHKLTKIDICVIGDSPIMNTERVFKSASTEKMTLSLMKETNWRNAVKHCHILVIGNSEADKLPEILFSVKNQPMLTISEIENFAESGGIVQFITEENSVKLIVNQKAAAAAGLRVDAQLLEIAKKVIGK